MDAPPLQSLSLTHVSYDPSSLVSLLCAYLALVPQALMITYVSFIFSTREIEIILMFAGQMASEALNFALKRYIQEDRPTQVLGKGYGMPSSHAQFVSYFSTYFVLFVLLRHDPHKANASTTHVPTPLWQRLSLAATAILSAAAVAQSRIYLNYHTPRQVYIGAALGFTCAILYFFALSAARHIGLIDWILDTPLARWVRLRDLIVNEDMVDAGWERWKTRRTESSLHAKKHGRSQKES